jgi:hypothetical protein
MPNLTPEGKTVGAILVVWAICCGVAVFGVVTLPPPPQWFDAWSKLVAAVAGTAVAARVLWTVPKKLQDFLDGIRDQRRPS